MLKSVVRIGKSVILIGRLLRSKVVRIIRSLRLSKLFVRLRSVWKRS